MPLELDHVFCFCEPDLPEAAALEAAGFKPADRRAHQGQGSANRCLLLEGNYLELIYLSSEAEARANPLRLHRRAFWRETDASPFGIGLRGEIPPADRARFWEYKPAYAPDFSIWIHRWDSERPEFPLLFVIGKGYGPGRASDPRSIARVEISLPRLAEPPLSAPLDRVTIKTAPSAGMALRLTGGAVGLRLNEILRIE